MEERYPEISYRPRNERRVINYEEIIAIIVFTFKEGRLIIIDSVLMAYWFQLTVMRLIRLAKVGRGKEKKTSRLRI